MFVPAPESTARVSLSKPGEGFEHPLCGIGFKQDLCVLDGVSLGDVHEEVNMVHREAEVTELEPEPF